jgi:hypothetical protein
MGVVVMVIEGLARPCVCTALSPARGGAWSADSHASTLMKACQNIPLPLLRSSLHKKK